MKSRRHHNNTGLRQVQKDKAYAQVRAIARRLRIPFDVALKSKKPGKA